MSTRAPLDAPLINVMVNVRSPSRAGIAYCVGVAVHPSHCALAHTTRRARPSLLDDTATSGAWRGTGAVCPWEGAMPRSATGSPLGTAPAAHDGEVALAPLAALP